MHSLRSLFCILVVAGLLVSACTRTKPEKPGDPCRAQANACVDATSVGACRAFTWHVESCRGPGGCSAGVCDQSIAAADDRCTAEGARACSTTHDAVLLCHEGAMVVEQACRGERGCFNATLDAPPKCDPGPMRLGDACVPAAGGNPCTADGQGILECSSRTHHVILARHCAGPKGCFKSAHYGFYSCDTTVGEEGEPCDGYIGVGTRTGNGGSYCSADGHEYLTCKEGILVAQYACDCAVHRAADDSYGVGCDGPLHPAHPHGHATAHGPP